MTAADDLTGIAQDLHAVDDLWRWAEGQAWWPFARGLDAPAGRSLPPRDPDSDPDHVPGPTHALGVGDHRAQQAIRQGATHLAACESSLRVCHTALVLQGRVGGPLLVRRDHRPLGLLANLRWLVVRLGSAGALPLTDGQKRLIGEARAEIDRAWRVLSAATSTGKGGPDTHATASKDQCIICGIRPRAPKKGKRCEVCARWKSRNGYERPPKLDTVHDARDAQARRYDHGIGWGDESLAWTDLAPLHDCTCTPTERCDNHDDRPDPGAAVVCGTPQGYLGHRRANHPPCDDCTAAWMDSRDRIQAMIRLQEVGGG